MKRNQRRTWILAAAGTAAILLIVYTSTQPAYGIRSRWKRLLLQSMVRADVPKVSAGSAWEERKEVVFLDTRSPEEFNVSHIAGARYVGYKDFDLAAIADIPKYYPIIAYCSIGKRSGEIGKRLADAGFTNVRNMYGGIFEWVNNGFPVVDRQGQPTDSTHTFDKTWSRWLHRGVKVY